MNTVKLPLIAEALENYPKIDELDVQGNPAPDRTTTNIQGVDTDEHFWDMMNARVAQGNYQWGNLFHFGRVSISEWVPRIPGMYWTDKAEKFREMGRAQKMDEWENQVAYRPIGKTQLVVGGLGTFKCSHGQENMLVSITASGNCSSGIPLLISRQLWEDYNLKEGSILDDLTLRWDKMASNWSSKFISSKNLIRGSLTFTDNNIKVNSYDRTAVCHPFTVIEYYEQGVPKYDFMFFSMQGASNRSKIDEWVNIYKSKFEQARYIFEPDPNEVLYGATYATTHQFLNQGFNDVQLIESKIESELSNQSTGIFDKIYEFLCNNISNENELAEFSKQEVISIPPISWRGGSSLLDTVKNFMTLIVEQKKLTTLYDLLQTDYSDVFITN